MAVGWPKYAIVALVACVSTCRGFGMPGTQGMSRRQLFERLPSTAAGAFLVPLIVRPAPAAAEYGAAPKMQIKDAQREGGLASLGSGIYETNEKEQMKGTRQKVCGDWEGISSGIAKSLAKGKAKDLRDIQDVLALKMATVKTGMRNVAKVAADGDILERDRSIAKFDYSSGQFTLKPVAQLPEDIFASVNEIYLAVGNGRKDIEAASAELSKADAAYREWTRLLDAAGL